MKKIAERNILEFAFVPIRIQGRERKAAADTFEVTQSKFYPEPVRGSPNPRLPEHVRVLSE